MHKLHYEKEQKASMNKRVRNNLRATTFVFSALLATGSALFLTAEAYAETSFERLSSLLAATPEGGWVKASTNLFSDTWAVGADAVPNGWPGAVVNAWSSFAWDSAHGQMMLWGGGHGNYLGNEMYVWDGATGNWGRGSLPSKIDARGFVVDSAAPQSAHTYDSNNYLPVNNMFLTFGGAAAPGGGVFQKTDGATVTRAGPFLWDPDKADPNKVGGTTGSGWNATNVAQGGNMWIDRQGNWTGSEAPTYVNGTSAYRTENGKDVIYLTADSNASGFPSLYRYTLGEVRNGEKDSWEKIGVTFNSVGYQGAATLDTTHNLYIRTANQVGPYTADLAVWDLDNSKVTNPNGNVDIAINLVNSDGSDFVMGGQHGIGYDSVNNTIVLWDGRDGGGTVWEASVLTDADGKVGSSTTWTVHEIQSSTSSHPHGGFTTGVLGKWHYDPTLGAFVALDQIAHVDGGAWDSSVWLYKPIVGTVPEPETYALLLAGLGLVGWFARRRQR